MLGEGRAQLLLNRDPARVSEVDHVAGDALDGFLDGPGQGRVGEHGAGDLVGGAPTSYCIVTRPASQRSSMRPAMPSTASLTASVRVGWANTLRATSSAVR